MREMDSISVLNTGAVLFLLKKQNRQCYLTIIIMFFRGAGHYYILIKQKPRFLQMEENLDA